MTNGRRIWNNVKEWFDTWSWAIATLICLVVVGGLVATEVYSNVVKERLMLEDLQAAQHNAEVATDEFLELKRRHDLAIEFGFNPIIVEIVDNQSREAVSDPDSGEQFRLIQTHEYLTHIFLSLIYTESKGFVEARGDKGKAHGLTQIWLSTARMYSDDVTSSQLMDPQVNIELSFIHFRHLLEKYRGNFTLALLAWNRGPGKVDKVIAWGQSPANGYGARVFSASVTASRNVVRR